MHRLVERQRKRFRAYRAGLGSLICSLKVSTGMLLVGRLPDHWIYGLRTRQVENATGVNSVTQSFQDLEATKVAN